MELRINPMEVLIIWFVCGVVAAVIGDSKGRRGCEWFLVGLFLGPFGLLMAVSMAPGTPKIEFAAAGQTVLYSEGKVRVTSQRLLVGDRSFDIKKLQTVKVADAGGNRWKIRLNNLSGETVYTLDSRNLDRIQRIANAINDGIVAPVGIVAPAPTTDVGPSGPTKSSPKVLAELEQMLDAGLITQDEFDKRKADILSKM